MIQVFKICIFYVFLCAPVLSSSQTIVEYFEELGLEAAAKLAHFNTGFIKESSSFHIFPQGIVLDLHYDFGYNTVLFVETDNGYFTNMRVVSDTHWYPAFDMVAILDALDNTQTKDVKDIVQKTVREHYESRWKKPTSQFNSEELVTMLLYYTWINFIHLNKHDVQEINQNTQEIKKENYIQIDGVKIVGNRVFQERIENALSLLKKYVPKEYNKYFVNGPGHYGLVKEIVLNTTERNTVNFDNSRILVGKLHGDRYSWSQEVDLAVTLAHEMWHLLQHEHFEMESVLNIDFHEYNEKHFGANLRDRAQIEIDAYKYTLYFLNKLDDTNFSKRSNIENVNKKTKAYTLLIEANGLLEDPDTVAEGCNLIDQFNIQTQNKLTHQVAIYKTNHCRGY